MKPILVMNRYSDERGMALVTALLILVALTLLSLTAMTNTTINTRIAGNDFRSQQSFEASEACAQVAVAALPAIIGKDIVLSDGTTDKVSSLDDLLQYNHDEGQITPLVDAVLNGEKWGDLNKVCNENPEETYSINVYDNDDGPSYVPDTTKPLDDVDGKFYLTTTVSKKNYKGDTIRKETLQLTLRQTFRLFKGAVNLLNPDPYGNPDQSYTQIVLGGSDDREDTLKWDGKIQGSDGMAGVITTDNMAHVTDNSTSGEDAQVLPHGVEVDHDKFDPGTMSDLEKFVDKLKEGKDPALVGGDIVIDDYKNTDVLGTLDHPKVTYIKGDVNIKGSVQGAGILIIEDYYGSDNYYHCDLTISDTAQYHGLIILLTRTEDYHGQIDLRLHDKAEIDGVVTAATTYKNTEKLTPAIKFQITDDANLIYDSSFKNVLKDHTYEVIGWDYKSTY